MNAKQIVAVLTNKSAVQARPNGTTRQRRVTSQHTKRGPWCQYWHGNHDAANATIVMSRKVDCSDNQQDKHCVAIVPPHLGRTRSQLSQSSKAILDDLQMAQSLLRLPRLHTDFES